MFNPKAWTQRKITLGLKTEINRRGLINTGLLYDSVQCGVEISDSGVMYVNIYAPVNEYGDVYLMYLWDRFKLMDFVYNSTARDGIANSYMQWVASMVKRFPNLNFQELKGKVENNPKIVFNIEGI